MEQGQFELDLKRVCLPCLVLSTARLFVPTAKGQFIMFVVSSTKAFGDAAPERVQLLKVEHGELEYTELKTPQSSIGAFVMSTPRSQAGMTGELPRSVAFSDRSESTHAVPSPNVSGADASPALPSRPRVTLSGSACGHGPTAMSLVDPLRLRQILRNLLSNAFKFTHAGRIEVELRLNGVFVDVLVSDSGVGMDASSLDRLFRPYVQFANDLQKGQGSGIGLSISRRLAELHGGELTCQSELNRGSTFKLRLPHTTGEDPTQAAELGLSVSDSPASSSHTLLMRRTPANSAVQRLLSVCDTSIASPASALSGEHVLPSTLQTGPEHHSFAVHLDVSQSLDGQAVTFPLAINHPAAAGQQAAASVRGVAIGETAFSVAAMEPKCALVVDDTALNVKLMCRLLRQRGWITIPAYDGVQAVDLMINLQRHHTTDTVAPVAASLESPSQVDVIFIDRNMPNMDGPEAVKRIRASGYAGMIVGLTGDVSPSSTLQFLEVGANLVIPKPVDIRQLDLILSQFSHDDSSGGC